MSDVEIIKEDNEINSQSQDQKKSVKPILEIMKIVLVMIVMQVGRLSFENVFSGFYEKTAFSQKMITMISMFIMTILLIVFAKLFKFRLSVFPKVMTKKYIIFTIVPFIVFCIMPRNYYGGWQTFATLLYVSIITPIYEELVFRGYIWNTFNRFIKKEVLTFVFTSVLFMVWHIGYMLPYILAGQWEPVISKMFVGLIYGLLYGAIRLKTKNCYSSVILHGIINMLML